MNEKSRKRKILKFELLSIDLQETEEVFEECETAFKNTFYDPAIEEQIKKQEQMQKDKKVSEEPAPQKEVELSDSTEMAESEHEVSEEEPEEEIVDNSKSVVKKMFKAIAKETHPDKLLNKDLDEVERRTELYKKAARAAKKNNVHELLEIIVSLGVTELLEDVEIFLLLDNAMLKMKEKISQMTNSVFWSWFHAEGNQKSIMEIQIQKQLGLRKRK